MRTLIRLPAAAQNPVSLLGAAIATAMAVLFLVLFLLDLLGYLANPYIGLLVFVAVPALFFVPASRLFELRSRRDIADLRLAYSVNPLLDLSWGSVRLQYDHAIRTGEGLDEQALSDIGEQVSLRQFDISDRNRDRVTAIVQVAPFDTFGFNGSVGIGQETRPDAAFGLQDNELRTFTVGFDATPRDTVLVGATYGFENYGTLQRSRQANPGVQFDDPTRDWSTDMSEDVHTLTASLELPQVAINRRLALGIGYAYDQYDVENFAMSPGTLNSPVFSGFVNLMYQARPYDAHTGVARLIYGR